MKTVELLATLADHISVTLRKRNGNYTITIVDISPQVFDQLYALQPMSKFIKKSHKDIGAANFTSTNNDSQKCLGCKYINDGRRIVPSPCANCSRFCGDNWQK